MPSVRSASQLSDPFIEMMTHLRPEFSWRIAVRALRRVAASANPSVKRIAGLIANDHVPFASAVPDDEGHL
jgi:hypothetical protein